MPPILGPIVVAAFFLAIIGWSLLTLRRERSHRDDLVIPGYGGTLYR